MTLCIYCQIDSMSHLFQKICVTLFNVNVSVVNNSVILGLGDGMDYTSPINYRLVINIQTLSLLTPP